MGTSFTVIRSALFRQLLAVSTALALIASTPHASPAQEIERFQPPTVGFPPAGERAYRVLATRVDGLAAMETVRHMDQFWRISGNPGFNSSIDYIARRLLASGFADAPNKDGRPFIRVEEWGESRGWDYQIGTVAAADDGEVLLSRIRDRVSLCINSFSTRDGGIDAPLVDVGPGRAADFEGKDVKGAVVLGAASVGQLWQ